jgi:2-oxoglutarate ferredoxin oxidoreductase subunit beta
MSENKNSLGLEKKDYLGSASTMCTGCGHDSITNHVITACYQSGIHPFDLAKMSGIGCSSKIPAYFISKSFSFNSMHGRMAPVTTGAQAANHNLTYLGVSGDGDSGSIGLGGFVHAIRRNVRMAYIIANNGVYGLTKGQFSATSDFGSTLKSGEKNIFEGIDLCSLALEIGATFVARSFSGDAKQMVPLIQAALKHRGTAILDVISPCITFNNHDGSTKSYTYVKEHDLVLQELGVISGAEEIQVDYEDTELVTLNDGSQLKLKKLREKNHNIHDRMSAMKLLYDHRTKGEILTGLFYIDEKTDDMATRLHLNDQSMAALPESLVRPGRKAFQEIMDQYA